MKFKLLVACLAACLSAVSPAAAQVVEFGPQANAEIALSTLQAGGHADLTTTFNLNREGMEAAGGQLRDVRVSLPSGFWGTPTAFPACSIDKTTVLFGNGQCEPASQVGTITVTFHVFGTPYEFSFPPVPVFNATHGPGVAAEFGAQPGLGVLLGVKVRSDDYGLDTLDLSVPRTALEIVKVSVTLWGVPADHNGSGEPRRPLMTNPAVCDMPLAGSVSMDSWEQPGVWKTSPMPVVQEGSPEGTPAMALTGCEHMPALSPALTAGPAGATPAAPSGYDIDLKVPQNEDASGIATPTVKNVKMTFPQGVAISPPAAEGLKACSDEQLAPGTDTEPSCPQASKVGTIEIKTPSLANPLEGAMYIGQPQPGHPYRLFLVARGEGVLLKLRGEAIPDPVTGQITTVFNDTPPLPFSELKIQLKGGPRALLATPTACGTYTTTATLTPYGGGAEEAASGEFTISGDGQGAACAPSQFKPTAEAGILDPIAGGSSPFVLRVQRTGQDNELKTLTTTLPPGLLAKVSSVPLCTSAQAAAAACPQASRIGVVTAGAGLGPDPLYITAGQVFLTEGYNGAPFGLDVDVPAIAGPYDLGDVNVRAALRIDPNTAQVTAEADPMPRILQGIPLQVRDLRIAIDRPGFTVTPTNCNETSVGTTLGSYAGDTASVPTRFQVGGCDKLAFKPNLKAASSSRTSRANGASLHIAIKAARGQANIAKVDTEVPKAFAVRDSTLNLACSEAQFAADPADCPAGSMVGTATAYTPILRSALSGPAIFVSHGGVQFPDLDIVLQGEGVTIVLTGKTFVKNGRLLSRFDSVPDAPISRFDLTLPQGPHSALSANGNLCQAGAAKLAMPTTIAGQNGVVIHQATKVSVSGCGKRKPKRHKRHK